MTDDTASSLEDVVITGDLAKRPGRAPCYEGESGALAEIAEAMANAPETVLQQLAEKAMKLTRSESAGISLLEDHGGIRNFRWVATAGAFAQNLGGTMPRDASPCGMVVDRNDLLLVRDPVRLFPALKGCDPHVHEALLAPLSIEGETVGTVWALKHCPEGRFDAEDARLLQSLARFASAGARAVEARRATEALRDEKAAGQARADARLTAELEGARTLIEKGRDFARESEERLRLIVENAQDYAIFTTDCDGIVTDWRVGAEAVFGYSREEITGQSCNILFVPEDREIQEPEKERSTAAEQGKATDIRWHLRKDGSRVFIDGVSTALRDPNGRLVGFLKIGQDVTERHAADERQRLLLAELQHRVRNILAMIRSVARRTAETSDTVREYAQHLEGRINAMARTQAILSREPGSPVDLQGIVQSELLSVVAQEDKVWCEGPAVCLEPKAAEILTLAIHELATNAVKYGAFSQPAGQLEIRWEVEDRGAESWLVFTWEEARVEGVALDGREGFGTELITRRVPYELGGSGTYELRRGGIRTVIEFPLRGGGSILETGAQGLGAAA